MSSSLDPDQSDFLSGLIWVKLFAKIISRRQKAGNSKKNLCIIIEPVHEISNNLVCATSKASDQPAHTYSLVRAFASHIYATTKR